MAVYLRALASRFRTGSSISMTPWRSSFGLAALALTPGLVAQFVVDNGLSRARDPQLPRQVES